MEFALMILQETTKKCPVHKIWYLAPGIPVYEIKEVIFQLNYIIDRTKPRAGESRDIKQ